MSSTKAFTLDLKVPNMDDLLDTELTSDPFWEPNMKWWMSARILGEVEWKYIEVDLHCEKSTDRESGRTWKCRTTTDIRNGEGAYLTRNHDNNIVCKLSHQCGMDGCLYLEVAALMSEKNKDLIRNGGGGIHFEVNVSPVFFKSPYVQKKQAIQAAFGFNKSSTTADTVFRLLESGNGTNLTMVSRDKEEFKVHRTILESKSLVFARMLEADMKEGKTQVVELEDMNAGSLKAFLRFLYAGDFSLIEEAELDEVKELINAAEKYEFPELKKYLLVEHTGIKNALSLYKFAKQFNLEEAVGEIYKFIEKHLKAFLDDLIA